MDKKKREIQQARNVSEKYTDQILTMESWLNQQTGGDKEAMVGLKRMCYGDEFDEEEGGLREL